MLYYRMERTLLKVLHSAASTHPQDPDPLVRGTDPDPFLFNFSTKIHF